MSNSPVKRLKDKGVVVSIFKNEIEDNVYYNTTFEKRFKNGDTDSWESTLNLNETDLLVASRLLMKAYDAISELKQS